MIEILTTTLKRLVRMLTVGHPTNAVVTVKTNPEGLRVDCASRQFSTRARIAVPIRVKDVGQKAVVQKPHFAKLVRMVKTKTMLLEIRDKALSVAGSLVNPLGEFKGHVRQASGTLPAVRMAVDNMHLYDLETAKRRTYRFPGRILLDLIKSVVHATSDLASRPVLETIKIETGKNFIRAVATNGHVLHVVSRRYKWSGEPAPTLTIHRMAAKAMIRIFNSQFGDGALRVTLQDNSIVFRHNEYEVVSKCVGRTTTRLPYPNYDQVVKSNRKKVSVRVLVSRKAFKSAIKKMYPRRGKHNLLRLWLRPANMDEADSAGRLFICSSDNDGDYAYIPVEYRGNTRQVTVNAKYLRDLVDGMTDDIVFGWPDPQGEDVLSHPALYFCNATGEDENYALLMPVRWKHLDQTARDRLAQELADAA